jgi:MazG family protein
MKEFDALLEVAQKLNSPGGCPWDLEQNFFTLQPYLLEEAHEVMEAVDEGDPQKILGELGDLFYLLIFYCKVAERNHLFTMEDLLERITEKMIHRHPHVFGESAAKDKEEVIERWEKIKQKEKAHAERKSALDGIPERLPALAKAQKIVRKALRADYPLEGERSALTEREVGETLLNLVTRAERNGIDVDSALRRFLLQFDEAFRTWEEASV